jgi:TolB-like protein/Flp pilus assembly protein TadD
VTEASRPVFLSYASQDAEAAQRIAESLRAARIEVWFDRSELRGGDAWDRRIRQQIHDCRLFIAVISANTEARDEGYFRREWRLAVERAGDMAEDKAFIVPVAMDGTNERSARVPDSFRHVQWTRLPGGETTAVFVSRIAGLLDDQEDGSGVDKSMPPARTSSLPHVWRRDWAWALLAVLMLVAGGAWLFLRHKQSPSAPPPPAVQEKSLAVLPFVDMSEKHDQEYFSDGLSEELIDRLVHSPDLKVIARTSSFAFKGKNDDVRTIAARLGVADLLEGSVRRSGDMLRITAQLIRASDGVHIWSESFDRNVANIFQIQEEIATTVAARLQTVLSARGADANANANVRPDAYNAFLRGKYFAQRKGKGDLDRSVAAYQDAIRLEPAYGLAWVELASTYNMMGLDGELKPDEAYRRARESVNKALEIDPNLAQAHFGLGDLLWNYQFDFPQARAEFSRARKLDPQVDTGNDAMIDAVASGRTTDAIREARRLIDRDPLRALTYTLLSWALYQNSQFEEAETAQHKALELNPTGAGYYAWLAAIALERNEPARALELLEQESDEASKQSGTIDALWMLGRRAESDRLLHAFEQRYGDSNALYIASAYVRRGDLDAAFRWLDRAYRNHEPEVTLIRGMRAFRDLHNDSRYKALVRKMNLPE